jgi:hypothetical protein
MLSLVSSFTELVGICEKLLKSETKKELKLVLLLTNAQDTETHLRRRASETRSPILPRCLVSLKKLSY